MNDEINYENNPLHALSLQNLLIEIVDHYGFEILFAYLNVNCFKTNPSIESSVKFLKKTDWAREKVEAFYLYEFKNLPRVSSEQFELPPRDRIVPNDQKPGEPAELSLDDAERLREKRAKKSAEYSQSARQRPGSAKGFGAQRSRKPDSRDSSSRNSVSRESGSRDSGSRNSDSRSSDSQESESRDSDTRDFGSQNSDSQDDVRPKKSERKSSSFAGSSAEGDGAPRAKWNKKPEI